MAGQHENSKEHTQRSNNAIDIFPLRAGLPWTSGIQTCRQSKHWRLAIETSRALLQHLADDRSAQHLYESGKSVAGISQKELTSGLEEGWIKFPCYLFSEADEQRTKLLAAINVFIFVFDGIAAQALL